MLSIEQRQDVLDVLLADHPDGRFSLQDVLRTAGSTTIVGDADAPTEAEVRTLLRSWQWRRIITRARQDDFCIRRMSASLWFPAGPGGGVTPPPGPAGDPRPAGLTHAPLGLEAGDGLGERRVEAVGTSRRGGPRPTPAARGPR